MSSDYIPDHVLADVLLRLPVDSLIRFKRVSKSWRDLIDSSYFKDAHSRRSSHSKMVTLVGPVFYAFDSVVKNGTEGYTAVAKKLTVPDLETKDEYRLDLAESCNGIVLFSSLTRKLVLWNPFTGSTLHVHHQLASPPHEFTKDWPYIESAFGYHHLNDDYKLIQWHLFGAPCFNGRGKHLYELCVYSFKHKSWTTITDAGKLDLDVNGGYLPRECTLAKGAMHWLTGNDTILAFDVGTYAFHKIPADSGHTPTSLSSLNGCLCLGYTFTSHSTGRFSAEYWVMKEYGIETSWTKIGCITDERCKAEMKAVAYYEKSRQLMLQPMWGNLIMYDFESKSMGDIVVSPHSKHGYSSKLVDRCTSYVCVGSFVSPHLLH